MGVAMHQPWSRILCCLLCSASLYTQLAAHCIHMVDTHTLATYSNVQLPFLVCMLLWQLTCPALAHLLYDAHRSTHDIQLGLLFYQSGQFWEVNGPGGFYFLFYFFFGRGTLCTRWTHLCALWPRTQYPLCNNEVRVNPCLLSSKSLGLTFQLTYMSLKAGRGRS